MDAIAHHLQVVDQPVPELGGPRDVRVAIRSAALNWVDLMMTSGQYQHLPAPPYTPGLEFAGVVDAVGAEVEGVDLIGSEIAGADYDHRRGVVAPDLIQKIVS